MSERTPDDKLALNKARLGDHAFDLFQRVLKLHNMSGPMPKGLEPTASAVFGFDADDGRTTKFRLTLSIDEYPEP